MVRAHGDKHAFGHKPVESAIDQSATTVNAAIERLQKVGLRPTRQRLALAEILFGSGERHVTAEELHAEEVAVRVPVSLATVYNTLNQFTRAGLLREVAIESHRAYFDTNISNHFHYYIESEELLLDIATADLTVTGLPQAPTGTQISRIDIVVRLKPERA